MANLDSGETCKLLTICTAMWKNKEYKTKS